MAESDGAAEILDPSRPQPSSATLRPEDGHPGASLEIGQPKGPETPYGTTRNLPLLADADMNVVLSVLKPEGFLLWHDTRSAGPGCRSLFKSALFQRRKGFSVRRDPCPEECRREGASPLLRGLCGDG